MGEKRTIQSSTFEHCPEADFRDFKGTSGVRVDNPNNGPHDCHVRCYPVSIDGWIDAAIVLPEITGYSPVQIEIIAAVGVREALDIDDGDSLRLEIQ